MVKFKKKSNECSSFIPGYSEEQMRAMNNKTFYKTALQITSVRAYQKIITLGGPKVFRIYSLLGYIQ